MKRVIRIGLALALATLTCFGDGVGAQEIPLVTGEHWTRSSEDTKKAYLVGIANLAQIEMAYMGPQPVSDSQSVVPRMVKGLKGQSLDSVREALNKWYSAHPDQINRPVLETIWVELVVSAPK
jgi:hypothetical protein